MQWTFAVIYIIGDATTKVLLFLKCEEVLLVSVIKSHSFLKYICKINWVLLMWWKLKQGLDYKARRNWFMLSLFLIYGSGWNSFNTNIGYRCYIVKDKAEKRPNFKGLKKLRINSNLGWFWPNFIILQLPNVVSYPQTFKIGPQPLWSWVLLVC